MAPEDFVLLEMPAECRILSASQLLDRAFPSGLEERQEITAKFDLRANPDLPDIYAVFLAGCDEWRDWRCAMLLTTASGKAVSLDSPVSSLIDPAMDAAGISLHMEQRYRAVEYAVRHGFWADRDELLDWMRALTTLYFLDKYEVPLKISEELSPALRRALESLQSKGLIATEGDSTSNTQPFLFTSDGRNLVAALLEETEALIDNFDHYRDTAINAGSDIAEFNTGRGIDLRVEAFLAEELDPIRAVFLLRLYDGSLDHRLTDWKEAMNHDAFYEDILEPVVNRHDASPAEMELVIESGLSWLEEQEELAGRKETERQILRRTEREDASDDDQ